MKVPGLRLLRGLRPPPPFIFQNPAASQAPPSELYPAANVPVFITRGIKFLIDYWSTNGVSAGGRTVEERERVPLLSFCNK